MFRPSALDALVEHVAAGPAEGSFSVTAQGGAIARVDDGATAYAGRAGRFDFSADTSWDDPSDDEAQRAWVRSAMAFVEPDAIEGRYANENADAGPAETRGSTARRSSPGLRRSSGPGTRTTSSG